MTEHTTSALPFGLRRSDLWTAAATGLLTLPAPARRSPLGRFVLRSAVAVTTGAAVWVGSGQDPETRFEARAGFTAGAVGLVYGVAELGEALDRVIHRRLVRLGVRRPRATMAITGVGLALAMSVLERRAEVTTEDDDATGPTYRPLPEHVRELVSVVLARTEDHDSLRLRAQLALAQVEVWGEDEDTRFVPFAVLDDVPLAVPRTFTFPVSARFTSARGVPCTVQLLVERGKLSALVVDVDTEAWAPIVEDWDPQGGDPDPLADVTLPPASDVVLVTESAGRP